MAYCFALDGGMNTPQNDGHQQVCTDYKGARICVRLAPGQTVSLHIDGISRQSVCISNKTTQAARLSSTLQTDYEWHEFIVALIEFSRTSALVKILANSQTIASKEVDL
jgi:hypothetical protein